MKSFGAFKIFSKIIVLVTLVTLAGCYVVPADPVPSKHGRHCRRWCSPNGHCRTWCRRY